MLKKLFVQNYAIIDELEIEFSGRMNVITGETGAGKSIIIGALGLILGDRADTSVLLNRNRKCVVEGFFGAENKKAVKDFLRQNDIDTDDEILVRREIAASGKSRSFINDTPVNLHQLRDMSILLVDLHRQFDTISLAETSFQRDVLDALAEQFDLTAQYQQLYHRWQNVQKECEELKSRQSAFAREQDYNQFQFEELDNAGFAENEIEETEAALKRMSNAEGIKNALSGVAYALQQSEQPVVQQLKSMMHQLQSYASFHPDITMIVQRLQSAQIELQDIAQELEKFENNIHYDPQRMEQLNERLSLGYKLLKKHGVQTTAELLAIRHQLQQKLRAVLDIGEEIIRKEKESNQLLEQAKLLAKEISEGRKKQAKPMETKVNKLLSRVGMPNARLKVNIIESKLNPYGCDEVEFLFNANVPSGGGPENTQFLPVAKVASGGELSRLMLCIKSLVARRIDLPVMIFDEIDTGISGEAAKQAGIIMKELAASRQIISITHQPQIAARADTHFFVYKEVTGDAVKTHVRKLDPDERITVIAQMLSGEKPTAAAIANAKEMVMG